MVRPNILLITTDEQRFDTLGCYGNSVIKTPHIDRLAQRGVRFDYAYVQYAVCTPSRTSILTGRYAKSHGVTDNAMPISDEELLLSSFLRTEGYHTAGLGKMHLYPASSHYGFETLRRATYVNMHSSWEDYRENDDYYQYLKSVGFERYWPDQDYPNSSRTETWDSFVSPIPEEHFVDTWIGDQAIRFLDETQDENRPFFAWVSFEKPHHPFDPPYPWSNMYKAARMPLPKQRGAQGLRGRPRSHQRHYERGNRLKEPFGNLSNDKLRQVTASYYGLISLIDYQVGRIMQRLEVQGRLDDTVIVFMSDHGEFLGEFGLEGKGLPGYDALHRVPMIWYGPKWIKQGATREELVQEIDLFPTVANLIGAELPTSIQGQSLLPLLGGELLGDHPGVKKRKYVFFEFQNTYSVRSRRYKLTHYAEEPQGELYDFGDDPDEANNIYGEPEYQAVQQELERALLDHLISLKARPTVKLRDLPKHRPGG